MHNRGSFTFRNYINAEFRRGYHMDYDRERCASRRDKVFTFFKIPIAVEKLILFGYCHCADSFLFVLTFLPIRFSIALGKFIYKYIFFFFRKEHAQENSLRNNEIIDLIKGFLIITCCFAATYLDTSMLYHLIKTQSAVKLYIFFNMLEIADKLMSAFGQDTLDALFWTATAPKERKRDYFLLIFHLFVSVIYISIHSGIVLLQALVLNVAVNSESKGLLTIVISNNFIEIKGSVFKKYDRNNLLQIACSDVRERFHQGVLIFAVIMLTMKEYSWKEERLYEMIKLCGIIVIVEMFIDWLKHAFIIRFNEIPVDVYKDYMLLIAADLVICKKQNAFSDHSDLVARRMGFTPLPLGVIIFRILAQTLKFNNFFSFFLLFVGYLCLLSFRILNNILILAVASWYIDDVNSTRTYSECERKDFVWRNAVDSYCERVHTPSRSRRRTSSKEDKLETTVKSSIGTRLSTEDSNCVKCLPRTDSTEDGSETSLTFLGESRASLMSNSMLNLVEIELDDRLSSSEDDELEFRGNEFETDDVLLVKSDKSIINVASSGEPTCTIQDKIGDGIMEISSNLGEMEESDILPILRKGVLVSDNTSENIIPSSTKHY